MKSTAELDARGRGGNLNMQAFYAAFSLLIRLRSYRKGTIDDGRRNASEPGARFSNRCYDNQAGSTAGRPLERRREGIPTFRGREPGLKFGTVACGTRKAFESFTHSLHLISSQSSAKGGRSHKERHLWHLPIPFEISRNAALQQQGTTANWTEPFVLSSRGPGSEKRGNGPGD